MGSHTSIAVAIYIKGSSINIARCIRGDPVGLPVRVFIPYQLRFPGTGKGNDIRQAVSVYVSNLNPIASMHGFIQDNSFKSHKTLTLRIGSLA